MDHDDCRVEGELAEMREEALERRIAELEGKIERLAEQLDAANFMITENSAEIEDLKLKLGSRVE